MSCVIVLPVIASLRGPGAAAGAPGGASLVSSVNTESSCGSRVSQAGQPGGPTTPSVPHLVLAGQTSWVRPNQQFNVDFSATGAPPGSHGLDVYVEVFDRLPNRSDFDQTMCNRIPTRLLQTFGPVPMSSLAPDPAHAGAVQLSIDVTTPGAAGRQTGGTGKSKSPPANVLDLATCSTFCAGVYPVQVILQAANSTDVLSTLTTHMVLVEPASGSKPLALAWTLPVSAPPTLSPGGKPTLSPTAAAGIAALSAAITSSSKLPLTLAPSPITLAALSNSSRASDHRSLAGFAAWASQPSHQVVAQPYAPVSPASLVAAGLPSELAPQLSSGESVVTSTLHVHPDNTTWLNDGTLNQAALADLSALPGGPVRQLVLSDTDLAPVPEQSSPQTTPTQPFALASPTDASHRPTGGHPIEAVTSDPGLASHLVDGPGAVLAAHQLLADLAMIYYDAPNALYSRGVVLQTASTWLPDPTFLQVALGGLAGSPIVQPVTLSQLFAQTPKAVIDPYGGVLVRQLASAPPAPLALPGRSLGSHRQVLASFASALGPNPPLVLTSMENVLLTAESTDLSTGDRTGDLDRLDALIRGQLAGVKLQTDTVTLTAQSAQLPITISSSLAYPITAVLKVSSDKLGFGPQNTSQSVTLTQRDKTVEFQVRARATGKFPVQVSLVSPKGGLTIASSRFAVRSSAISPVAIGLTVAAGLVLAGWWGRTLLRGRRNRNPRLVPSAPTSE